MAVRWIRLFVCLATIFTIGLGLQHTQAAASTSDVKVFLDTKEVQFPVPPKIKNGTTLVPFRGLFEALGMEVTWEPTQRLVTGKDSETIISLVVGQKKATVNTQTFTLLEAPEIVNGSTLVPLRFIGESTGASVFWDPYNREVSIVTLKFMEENNISKEELERAVQESLDKMAKEEEERKKKEEQNKPKPPEKPLAPVDLNNLNGMYAGFRADYDGFECGGMCWDIYTFLPNKKVHLGVPANGGPETIDCGKEPCLSYSIAGGQLKLSNGKSLPIKKSETGFLMINNIKLTAVQPVAKGLTLDNKYKYMGFSGLIGVHPAATSWTYYLTLRSDGTFELSGVTLGSLGANTGTSTHVGSSGDIDQGTYKIENNTITMTSSNGTVQKSLFFLHDGDINDIQIGLRNYWVD